MNISRHLACLVIAVVLAAGQPASVWAQDAGTDPTTLPATRPAGKPASGPSSGPASRPGGRLGRRPSTQTQTASAKADTIDACLNLYNRGDYSAAADGFKKLQDKAPLAAALGLADALKMEGKYAQAVEALNSIAEQGARDAAWNVAMAELMNTTGDYDKSLQHAAKAQELKPEWAPGVYAHGMALETVGRKDDALAVYKNIDAVLKDDTYRRDARSLVAVGGIMDRHTVLSGKKASDQATNILQHYLQQAYREVDKKYWPAHVAAGQFLMQNYRPNQAMAEFQLADKINPRIPDVGVGIGLFNLQTWQFEGVLKNADQVLEINPNCAEAHLLKAACMMQWRKFDKVAESIQKVLAVNPNHLEALSMQAALYVRQGQPDKVQPIIDKVLKLNPRCSMVYNAIGEWLAAGRQFKEAEGYYLKAIELTPELSEPLANLGMLYMQTGEEQKALEPLAKAHQLNDFREDVFNYLKLVKELLDPSKYLVRETPHFIVKVNAEFDRVMLDEVSDYMEAIYPEITRDFGYQPPAKTLIEILPKHDLFSVRITGKGWVPTVGACTGNVIVLSAPTKDRAGSSGTVNWAVVLRHEYTHVVTLTATGNRMPHWFTEACAVFQQPDKKAFKYIQALVQATRTGKLFPVKDIDWGFIRPKTPGERMLAYCQSEWMLQFIIAKYGYDPTVVNMIHGFGDGLTQTQVFERVLKTDEAQFDKDFKAWAKEQVKEWRFDPEPPPDPRKSAQQASTQPNNAAAQALNAVALYNSGQVKPALAVAKKALDIDADNVKALAVTGYCQMLDKKYDDAIRTAKHLEEVDHTSVHSPRILAQCYMEKRIWAEAIAALELFKQRQPLDQYSYTELARIYTSLGLPDKALPNLLEIHKMTMDDAQWARRIADIYRSTGQDTEALEFYRQVTYVNPYEVTTYEAMAALYLKARQYDQAVTAADKLTMLLPDSAEAWYKDAAVTYQSGSAKKDLAQLKHAKALADKAVAIDADSGAKDLLEQIDKEIRLIAPTTREQGPGTREQEEATTRDQGTGTRDQEAATTGPSS